MISFILSLLIVLNPFPYSSNSSLSCKNLVYIGDSLTSNGYDFYVADFNKLNFSNVIISAAGSRSLTSKRPTDVHTGLEAISYWKNKYPKSTCWIISLGTNDSGYVSAQYARKTITESMSIIGKSKTIWVDVWKGKVFNSSKAKSWNSTLSKTLAKYPNAKVLNWTTYVKSNKNIIGPDGVHYTSLGYKQRSKFIATNAALIFAKNYSTQ